jgi:predicted XRE-type DNA-binding protein
MIKDLIEENMQTRKILIFQVLHWIGAFNLSAASIYSYLRASMGFRLAVRV